MNAHDCENCQSSGDCDIEADLKELRVAFAKDGMIALVDALVVSFSSPVKFANTLREASMVLDHNLEGLYQFRILTYQNKDRFPAGAEKGLHMVFTSMHKAMGQEMLDATLQEIEKLAGALGVPNTLMAVKMSGNELRKLTGMDDPKPTKPLTFH